MFTCRHLRPCVKVQQNQQFTEKRKAMESKMNREIALRQWLSASGIHALAFSPLPADASFRRYFRIQTAENSLLAMDAPPPENCQVYTQVAQALRALGLCTPEILAADLSQGFLVITDFGDATFLKTLNHDNADQLYSSALTALAILQSCQKIPGHELPIFGADWMRQEWQWHKEWFINKLLGLQLGAQEKILDECYQYIVNAAVSQPQVFMHRDYHSANLMVLPENQVGILDFQDAFIGPMTYDLVSLLRDCYIAWPKERVLKWIDDYRSHHLFPDISRDQFLYFFDLMGIERHLKALFTFSRKKIRDGQSQYLQHVQRTLHYLLDVMQQYTELTPLHDYYQHVVAEKVKLVCAQ
jgi:N-acetylmuramate 1-kinase